MLTPAHVRSARALLSLTQEELAKAAGVSPTTVRGFETEKTTPTDDTLSRLRLALEKMGVRFLNGGAPGVFLASSDHQIPKIMQ